MAVLGNVDVDVANVKGTIVPLREREPVVTAVVPAQVGGSITTELKVTRIPLARVRLPLMELPLRPQFGHIVKRTLAAVTLVPRMGMGEAVKFPLAVPVMEQEQLIPGKIVGHWEGNCPIGGHTGSP